MNINTLSGLGACGAYNSEHDFGESTDQEERGVLVITHGRRTGRIYTVERSWTEQSCKRCGCINKRQHDERSFEWPGGV